MTMTAKQAAFLGTLGQLKGAELSFDEMDGMDRDCFAGADEGALIAYTENRTLILLPDGDLHMIDQDGNETVLTIR